MSLSCILPSTITAVKHNTALSRAITTTTHHAAEEESSSSSSSSSCWYRIQHIVECHPHQAHVWTKQPGFLDGTIEANVLPLHQLLVLPSSSSPFQTDQNHHSSFPLTTTTRKSPKRNTTIRKTTTTTKQDVIRALVDAYPEALQLAESSYERLPLHCACRSADTSLETIQFLVSRYPAACLIPDALQRLPLHYALTNHGTDVPEGVHNKNNNSSSCSIPDYLLHVHPEAARGQDIRGFTPLHVACAQLVHPRLIVRLLQLFPEAAGIQSHSGITPEQCIPPLLLSTTANHCPNNKLQQRRLEIVTLLRQQQVDGLDDMGPLLQRNRVGTRLVDTSVLV